jgi:hypothetical protein
MPRLIALRAAFGQDEANHGIRRYRVGGDGFVHVPAEAALFLVSKGGFVVETTTVNQVSGSSLSEPLLDGTRSAADPSSQVLLHRDGSSDFVPYTCKHQGGQNRDVLVPAGGDGGLLIHGFVPAARDLRPCEREVAPEPIGLERSSIGNAKSTAAPSKRR